MDKQEKYSLMKLKESLKERREKEGLSILQLSKKINVNYRTAQSAEDFEHDGFPDMSTIVKLCNFYKCDIEALFGNINSSNSSMEQICHNTGLSEDAITILQTLAERSTGRGSAAAHILDCIDSLIRAIDLNNLPGSVLFDIGDFIDCKNIILMNSTFAEENLIHQVELFNTKSNIGHGLSKEQTENLKREFIKTQIYKKLQEISDSSQSATVADNNKKERKKKQ